MVNHQQQEFRMRLALISLAFWFAEASFPLALSRADLLGVLRKYGKRWMPTTGLPRRRRISSINPLQNSEIPNPLQNSEIHSGRTLNSHASNVDAFSTDADGYTPEQHRRAQQVQDQERQRFAQVLRNQNQHPNEQQVHDEQDSEAVHAEQECHV